MEEQQEDFKSLPIIDRLSHKVWKARVSAYEELVSLFRISDNPSDFYQYEPHLKKMVTDANAVAQEAGLNAVLQFVENAPSAANTRETVIPALVEKCFGAAKAGTKAKANDIVLMYAEIDVADPVVELVIPGLNAKQPKAVAQTVVTLKELVRQFGVKTVNPKPILKIIPKLFGHADKNVRAEASTLTIELYRWIGPAVNQFLSELKPVQIKELEESFSQLPQEKAVPERLLRSQQALVQSAPAENEAEDVDMNEGGEAQDEEDDTNALDLADPVDILSKVSSNFFELLVSKKWQERKEAMEELLNASKTPKIADRDYSELMSGLAKRINDTNVLLGALAANCIEAIANGLRQSFHRYKATVTPPLIDKLKERKPQVLEQLCSALDAVLAVSPFEEIVEDISTGAKHKNPQVRAQCIKLLTVRLTKIRQPPSKGEIKALAELMLKTIDDADSATREHSAEGLGTLAKVVGEKALAPFTEKLDDIKAAKVKEACDKAVVKAKPAGPPKPVAKPPPPAAIKRVAKPKVAAPPKSVPTDMAVDDDYELPRQPSPPKRKPPARGIAGASAAKKPALSSMSKPSAPSAGASAGPKKAAKLPASAPEEPVRYKFSPEDTDERISEYVPEEILSQISDSQWKIRLAAMEALYEHLEKQDSSSVEPEIIIRVLSKKPGWKEMNFQVMGKLFNTMQLLSSNNKFTKACAAIGIPGLTEKLGDIKLKKHAGDCLVAFAEKTSLQFVLSQAYPMWRKQKSPKVLADSLTWLHSAIMDFGISGLQIRDVIDFLKYALTNTNASVRTSAVLVLGALRIYIGPEVKSFVQDVSPALLATIEAEFDKVASMEPPQPTKGSADEEGDTSGNAAIESLFPRVDISAQLSKVASECNDSNWKVRKEGLEKTLGIINDANKRIKPNLGDFLAVLKARLNDSNKNLQIMTLEITGLLATSMGKPFERYVKTVVSPVISVLTDNKANVRAAGVAALVNLQTTCGLEPLVAAIATGLSGDSPSLRKDLLTWLDETLKEGATTDLSPLINSILSCLQDRNAEVRKAAQACLPYLISSAGYDQVMLKVTDLKAAQRQTVMPFIEAAKGQAKSANSNSPVPSSVASHKMDSRRMADSSDSAEERTVLPKPRLTLKKKPAAAGVRSVGSTPSSRSPAQSAAMSPAPSSGGDDASAPILTSDNGPKLVRAKKENRWQFESPRPDLLDSLRNQIGSNFGQGVIKLMFSKSQHAERDFLSAINILDECIADSEVSINKYGIDFSEMKQRYIANADLVFKYLTIRFFDTNTSMLIKCLDLTEHLVAVMEEEGYHLSEYEAISFLPFLINKVGDPKESMRARIRGILIAMCRIYPGSKMFNHLLDVTANSKNAKARSECLEEVGALIQRNGISVMLPQKALPVIASHISDRDAGVRNAALGAVAQAYTLIGDPVYKYVGRLSEKDKSMVEERLKRTKTNVTSLPVAPKRSSTPQDVHAEQPHAHSELPRPTRLSLNKSKLALPRPRQVIARQDVEPMDEVMHEPERELMRPPAQSLMAEQRAIQSPPHVTQISPERNEYMMDFLITQITSGDPHPSIDALKKLDKILSTQPEMVIPDADPLVNAITLQVRLAFSALDGRSAPLTRLCKHLVNALVLLFSNRQLASHVSQDALHRLLQELAHRLLDVDMLSVETGPQLSKALNVAMVKVLEFSDRNASISALLAILVDCAADLRPGDSTTCKEARFTELIMKCLWKLSKTIQEHMRNGSLNPDQLLLDINNFFVTTPPTEWKHRAADHVPFGEMPLRTAKTLILELITGLGDSVFDHLTLIDDPQRSCVYPYLHHMLQARRKKQEVDQQTSHSNNARNQDTEDRIQEPPPTRASRPSSITSANDLTNSRPVSIAESTGSFEPPPALPKPAAFSIPGESQGEAMEDVQHSPQSNDLTKDDSKVLSDLEMNNLLTQIFVKIGTRDQTKQGIVELYEFQKRYPHAETKVNAYLSQTGNYFQSYIRRGLNNLSAEDDSMKRRSNANSDATDSSSVRSAESSSPRTSRPQSTVEDPVEIKQRLLRLQQKFGYRQESDESDPSAGLNNIQKRASILSLQEPTQRAEPDRAQSVSALKERLARMKATLESSATEP